MEDVAGKPTRQPMSQECGCWYTFTARQDGSHSKRLLMTYSLTRGGVGGLWMWGEFKIPVVPRSAERLCRSCLGGGKTLGYWSSGVPTSLHKNR